MTGANTGSELGMPVTGNFFEDILDPFVWPLMSAGSFRPLSTSRQMQARTMPIDIKEKEKEFQISADVPGVKKEDIQLDHEGDTLMISVDHKEEKQAGSKAEEEGTKWHRIERSSFFVKRSLRLPESADFDNITAAYKDGVLSVSVPKLALEQQKRKRINVQ